MKNVKPFFSIIMPIYNVQLYLEKAIRSVIRQTYQNFELILINDGSTDSSLNICTKFANIDPRIKVLDLKINQGLSNARNEGLKIAKGVYIGYIDADDYIARNLLEIVESKIKVFSLPEAVKFGLFEEYYDSNGNIVYIKIVSANECYLTKKKEIIEQILKWENLPIFGYTWNTFYKKSSLDSFKGKFEKIEVVEDFLYNLQFFNNIQTVLMLKEPLYHYSKRSKGSLSSKHNANYFKVYTLKIKAMLNICEKNNLKTPLNMELIASLYSRYIYSMLERSIGKKRTFYFKTQKNILEELYQKELFKELIPFSKGNSLKEKIMFSVLKHEASIKICWIVFFIHGIKKYLPILFNRLK